MGPVQGFRVVFDSPLSASLEQLKIYLKEVKGAAPLCNLSVWEPRFGGFTWGWGLGWYLQGSAKGPR